VFPSDRRITVDRGEVYEQPLRAVECSGCGALFADDEERARVLARHGRTSSFAPAG
jgi:hypothetical protein